MKKKHLSLLPLLVVMYGCQHGMHTAQASMPPAASAQPAPVQAPAAPVAATAEAQLAAAPAQPAVVSQPEQAAQPAPAVVQAAAAPSPEPAPSAVAIAPAAAKPEPKPEAVLSDAEGRKLGQKDGCFVCHTVEKKLVGPGWKDIAAKYRGQKDAEAKLITKVAKGGSGVWGSTAMPPNAPRVSGNDIQSLVRFILSLK